MTQPTHARFAPSAMYRIARCPGSVRATAGVPETSSDYAQDGTEAHTLLRQALAYGIREVDKLLDSETAGVNGIPLRSIMTYRADTEAERLESVQEALDYVYDILDAYEDAKLFLEEVVHFPSDITDDVWGTLDIRVVVPSFGLLYIIDFKHGSGYSVPVIENEQLDTYAVAALSDNHEGINTVITAIIQPRAFNVDGTVRTDVRSVSYYANVVMPRIEGYVRAALDPTAPLVPGAVQCKFCPIKVGCPAREAAALAVVSTTFHTVKDVSVAKLPEVTQLSSSQLAYIMQAASGVLKPWLADVEDAAYRRLRGGDSVPGFKLVEAQPRRRWHGEIEETAVMLSSLTGLPLEKIIPPKLITITEADKLVANAFKDRAPRGKKKQAAEEAKNAMAHLTTKSSSGNFSVASDSDPRPAVNIAAISFSNVQQISPPPATEED